MLRFDIKLAEYECTIDYRAGKANTNADVRNNIEVQNTNDNKVKSKLINSAVIFRQHSRNTQTLVEKIDQQHQSSSLNDDLNEEK